jgi:hypothetical protein
MKITVEIDCTPAEARQFFGLPNVEPMQAAMMTKLEKRMSEEMDRFSPDALMKTWLSLFPQNTEWAQKMFGSCLGPAAISGEDSSCVSTGRARFATFGSRLKRIEDILAKPTPAAWIRVTSRLPSREAEKRLYSRQFGSHLGTDR